MPYFFDNQSVTKVFKRWKLPFLSTVILSFLVHGFVLTNRMPTWDGLRNFYSTEQMDTSGRFFLTYANGISSYFELQWLNGVLSILYLAIIVIMIIELFDIKSTLTKILISAIVVTIPTVTATLAYMYTADGYFLATMLTMIALVITKKLKLGFLFSPILIFIAVGIYQANLAVALSFMILYIAYLFISNNQPIKSIFIQTGKMLFPIFAGMVLYLIYYKYKTTLGGVEITSYKGLDEAGGVSLTDIPERILYMFQYIFSYFFSDELNVFSWNLYEILNGILLLFLIAIVIFIFIQLEKKFYMIPLLLLLVGLPFALFIIIFTSPSVEYHTIMTFSTVVVYLIPLLLMDKLLTLEPIYLRKMMVYFTLLFTIILTFNFAILSNISYMNMEYRTEKTVNLLNRIATSIEENPDHLNAEYLHVIGSPRLDATDLEDKMKESVFPIQGTTKRHVLQEEVQIVVGLENYVGLSFERVKFEDRERLNQDTAVEEMKVWPHKDSILLLDDTLVIKFSEE